ncbi:hypothetical protein [Chryseobacterium sp. 3008163]|uniref:hypothetical protein n=1 Tax=Chryseobacterium sp. 3008163 TaxID=2478663 RepID=UPI000F0C1EEC|nr:hypothetical protein [Chryseobacterium sp. 3008163]AYN01315.1 hypothetical protein EAG08_14270 [Chryseobacterium sp. 3008163]
MKKIIYITSLILFITSCESRTYEEISDNTPIAETVRYQTDIKPIIDANCTVCHSAGGSASFQPWTNYNQVKTNIDNIINRIQRPNGDPLKMPQGGSLSQNQINLFVKWKADGLIEN